MRQQATDEFQMRPSMRFELEIPDLILTVTEIIGRYFQTRKHSNFIKMAKEFNIRLHDSSGASP